MSYTLRCIKERGEKKEAEKGERERTTTTRKKCSLNF